MGLQNIFCPHPDPWFLPQEKRPFPNRMWFTSAIRFWYPTVAIIGVMATPAIALAHGAHIQARTTSAVEIQASYDSGEPMAAAQVQVYGPENPQTPVFSGMTDESGYYLFVPDRPGDWEVSVRQAGHGDIAVIPVSEAGAITAEFSNTNRLSPLQRGIIAGAVVWGSVGTALYFRRGKR